MPNIAPFALVEAFCSNLPGSGNPAGVALLDEWISYEAMQQIAATVNQAETAFLGPDALGQRIRWFTPNTEVDLCGHATLATAAFLADSQAHAGGFEFQSRSGPLSVSAKDGMFALDFPSIPADAADLALVASQIPDAVELYRNKDDWMVLMPNQKSIEQFMPDFDFSSALGQRGMAITAKGAGTDFCCRFFAPQSGVPEDHATGSAQTYLVPFWAERLGVNRLTSIQLSSRRGHFASELVGDRVKISGQARILVTGKIVLPE